MISKEAIQKKIEDAKKISDLVYSEPFKSAVFQAALNKLFLEGKFENTTSPPNKPLPASPVITSRTDGKIEFNVIFEGSRYKQQQQAILLFMKSMRNQDMTSSFVSDSLFNAGIDTKHIKDAFALLRNNKPKLINSKPRSQRIFLTPNGEREALTLEKQLKRKDVI